jgi:hypothetical protein
MKYLSIILTFLFIQLSNAFGMEDKVSLASFYENNAPRPTQFLYGVAGVENRKRTFLKLINRPGKLQKYLDKKPIPYVLRKDGARFIIDRHHFSRALFELQDQLLESSHEIKITYQKIELSGVISESLKHTEFEKQMKNNSFTYLVKQDGSYGAFIDLPGSIMSMKNDFYRSLAWLVRKSGAYDKTKKPYLEFYWATYLKRELSLSASEETSSKKTLIMAIKASIVPNRYNQILPGFIERYFSDESEIRYAVNLHYKILVNQGLMPK